MKIYKRTMQHHLSFTTLVIIPSAILISCSNLKNDDCQPDNSLKVETTTVTDVNATHATIYTDIVINEPADKVWKTLTDFNNMPKWSSTLKSIQGDLSNGGSVTLKFDVGGDNIVDIHRTGFNYQEGVLLGWSGEVAAFPGLTDNHVYRIEPISKCQTRFIQTDEFKGEIKDATPIALANQSLVSYTTFNQELKKEVEK